MPTDYQHETRERLYTRLLDPSQPLEPIMLELLRRKLQALVDEEAEHELAKILYGDPTKARPLGVMVARSVKAP